MTKDEETEQRIDELIQRLELHLERLMIIEALIKDISDDRVLVDKLRKLIK